LAQYTHFSYATIWFAPIVSPYDYNIRYTKTEEQVKVQIIHNGESIIQFVFGQMVKKVCLNEQLIMYLDDQDHLASIVIRNEKEVPKVIRKLAL